MKKTFTISIDEELHKDFKILTAERKTSISEEITLFMQSEIEGREKKLLSLLDSVELLTNRIEALESSTGAEGDHFNGT